MILAELRLASLHNLHIELLGLLSAAIKPVYYYQHTFAITKVFVLFT